MSMKRDSLGLGNMSIGTAFCHFNLFLSRIGIVIKIKCFHPAIFEICMHINLSKEISSNNGVIIAISVE